MATAADLAGGESAVNTPLRRALGQWEHAVADELVGMGVLPARARGLAVLMISALEGAIMWARVDRDTAPLDIVVSELAPVLRSAGREAGSPRSG
jgi:hypothetical protein